MGTELTPLVGATIGYLVGDEGSSLATATATAIGAGTGGVTALLSHGVEAGLRTIVSTSPEPARPAG